MCRPRLPSWARRTLSSGLARATKWNSCRLLDSEMTLTKLQVDEGDPHPVVNQTRTFTYFKRLVEDDGFAKRFWGHVRQDTRVHR